MLQSLMVPGCRVEGVRCKSRSLVVLWARRRRDGARCPDCSHLSGKIHGYYRRRPADLPLCGRQVCLNLQLRRYVCINVTCRRRTFAERVPMLLAQRSRRTRRLARAQTQVGVALGGEPGRRLARWLAMPTSGDTLLRLVRAASVAAAAPTTIGVDDWALKKRTRYGTIIVDLEQRRPIDLLPDRDAKTLAAWLQARPGIDLVARDRSAEYRRAITSGAPSAVQVADRWHLLCDARQMAERWVAGAYARLQRLPPVAVIDTPSLVGPRRSCGPALLARSQPTAVLGAKPGMMRCIDAIALARDCGPSAERPASPAPPWANTPVPRSSPSACSAHQR